MKTMPASEPGSPVPTSIDRPVEQADLPPPPASLGLRWRALGPADLEAVADLFAWIERFDNVPFRTSPEEARELLEGARKDPERNTLGGFDSAGQLRAHAFVQLSPGDARLAKVLLDGGVDPAWRRRGIGTALLRWQVARARQLLATGPAVPGRIATYVEDGFEDKASIFSAAGFVPRRYYTEMRRDLSLPIPDVSLREGLVLVPWTPERDDAVRQAHNEAFAEDWGSAPQTPESWAEGRSSFAPEWSFVVLDRSNDRSPVAGYLLSDRYEQDWPALGYSEGYIDVLGVRRAWRGKRVATVLLTAAMRAYADDGIQYAGLGVDTDNPSGAVGIFAALGFEPTRGSAMYCLDV
jgi:mycothiol synthase